MGLPTVTSDPILALRDEEREKRANARRPSVITTISAPTGRNDEYVRSMLAGECEEVRSESSGSRNVRLNNAAIRLGHYVGGGHLDAGDVQRELLAAAESSGLGRVEAIKTIDSGMRAGMREPQDPPTPRRSELRMNAPVTSTTPPKPQAWLSLSDRLRQSRGMGPRYALGIAPLDDAMRGGMRVGQVGVIGGAPGAGKTTLVVQIARYLARSGVAVAFNAIDEAVPGIDARLMQAIGIPRDDAEEPSDDVIARAAAEYDPLPLWIVDSLPIEVVFCELAKRYPDQPRAVICDSLQKVRTARTDSINNIRERIDDTMDTAKALSRSRETGAMVLFTSELARGSYRSKRSEDWSEDLAAFKESGGIEYGVDLGVVLRTARGDAALVHGAVPKCRMGRRGDRFALRLDFETATFGVVENDDHEADPDAGRVADVRRDLVLAMKGEGWIEYSKLHKLAGRRKGDVAKALHELIGDNIVTKKAGGLYSLTSEAS